MPLWGQAGRFLITVDGVRALVSSRGFAGYGLEFRVVDMDRPFISETGYRSDMWGVREAPPMKMEDYARARLAALMEEKKGLRMVEEGYRERRNPLPAWVPALDEVPVAIRQEAGGQLALAL